MALVFAIAILRKLLRGPNYWLAGDFVGSVIVIAVFVVFNSRLPNVQFFTISGVSVDLFTFYFLWLYVSLFLAPMTFIAGVGRIMRYRAARAYSRSDKVAIAEKTRESKLAARTSLNKFKMVQIGHCIAVGAQLAV
jgi:hypothetical protein